VIYAQAKSFTVHAVYMLGMLVPLFAGFLGPSSSIPFGSVIHFTVAAGLVFGARSFANQTGFFHTYCPPEPRASLAPQLLKALAFSARMLDCMTDMAFVKVLLHEVWAALAQCRSVPVLPVS
jgi:hypothetical protein